MWQRRSSIGRGPECDRLPVHIPVDRGQIRDFCRSHHIRRLALFGSVLRSDFETDSDIDVLVEFEPGHVPGFALFSFESELSTLFHGQVDLNTPASLSRYFRDEVVRGAWVLYDEA